MSPNNNNTQTELSTFYVIDPANRTGKIGVPAHLIFPTLGRRQYVAQHTGNALPKDTVSQEWSVRTKSDYSLCLLFQQGRCKAANQCRQIHADPAFVESVRARAAKGSTCCAMHGDPRADDSSYQQMLNGIGHRFTLVLTRTERHILPMSALARTCAINNVVGANKLFVERSRLCRLHLAGKCRFGCDCKNYHICREIFNELTKKASPKDAQQFVFNFPNKAVAVKVNQDKKSANTSRRQSQESILSDVPIVVVVPPAATPGTDSRRSSVGSPESSIGSSASSVGGYDSCSCSEGTVSPVEAADAHDLTSKRSLGERELSDLTKKLLPFAVAFHGQSANPPATPKVRGRAVEHVHAAANRIVA